MPGIESFVPAAAQTLLGLGQTLFSGVKKANRNLENYANSYRKNESIMDYFNKSLAKYSANPFQSQSYLNAVNNTGRNLTTGINAAQDRRGGLATISGLVQGANDANARAAASAEAQGRADLQQLGVATRMKAAEDYKPFEMKYNLLSAKAGAAAGTKRNGLQNIFGGLSTGAMLGIGGKGSPKGSTPSWKAPTTRTTSDIPEDEMLPLYAYQ